jgi:hypothetical protein
VSRTAIACLASVLLFISLSGSLAIADSQFDHGFLVPVTLCGILVGISALRWLLGDIDVFDPVGIIGLLGVHFFYVAPLLHVSWGTWLWEVGGGMSTPGPRDWRPWLEKLAWLNAAGLVTYMMISHRLGRSRNSRPRVLDHRSARRLLLVGMIITAIAQAFVFFQFGGVAGMVDAYVSNRGALGGFGVVFLVSESFPILAFMMFALIAREHPFLRRWGWQLFALVVFVILKLVFGGLRGSRSNTMWGLFWAVGIIHFWVRPLPRRLILAGLPLLFVFMYLYGFYKSAGTDALRAFEGADARAELESSTHRTMDKVLLQDLARTDVQAFIVYVQDQPTRRLDLAYGRTYLGAAAQLIPRSVWPDRPPPKVQEGTDLFQGHGAYEAGYRVSKIYGLAGEALLNFGSIGVPIAFAVLGVLVARVRRVHSTITPDDGRALLLPLLVNLCFVVLTSDSDNVVFFLIKNGTVPTLVIWWANTHARAAGRGSLTAACSSDRKSGVWRPE